MNYLDELRFSVKYPFTELAKRIVSEMKISFDNLDPVFIDRAIQRINQDVKGGVLLNANSRLTRVLEADLVSFPVSKIIVSLSPDSFLKKKFVSGEANALRKFLFVEKDEVLNSLALELGIKIVGGKVHYKSYLKFIPPDESYKLVYQDLSSGYIRVNRSTLVELITTAFSRKLESDISRKPKGLEHLSVYLSEVSIERKQSINYSGPVDADAFPPCMKKLLADASAGVHLGHNARFALAAFLVNVGLDEDKIIDVFRGQDNFNERLTRYHVEYIMGKKGSGSKRLPPSCDKMKVYGLCFNPDNLCKRIKNPLGYYKAKIRRRNYHGSKGMAER